MFVLIEMTAEILQKFISSIKVLHQLMLIFYVPLDAIVLIDRSKLESQPMKLSKSRDNQTRFEVMRKTIGNLVHMSCRGPGL